MFLTLEGKYIQRNYPIVTGMEVEIVFKRHKNA
jgi:hypothetical protein